MKGRKGQFGTLPGVVATLIAVAVILAAGFFIMQEFRDNEVFVDTSATVVNETGGDINDTSYTVDRASVPGFNSFSVTQVTNTTGGEVIGAGNYTVNPRWGTVVGSSGRNFNWSAVNTSYTYDFGEEGYLGVNDTLGAILTIPDLFGLLILIVMVGLVLAVVFNVIPGSRVGGA